MVIAFDTVTPDVEALTVDVTISGLTVGVAYDVMRLTYAYDGLDASTGDPVYSRRTPDRREFWQAVGGRVDWHPETATVTFRDYEATVRPFAYYVVESADSPRFHDFRTFGDYDETVGVLDDAVVFLGRLDETIGVGEVIVRSTVEPGSYWRGCVYDVEQLTYAARGSRLDVLGTPFPVYVAATRQARQGRLILTTRNLDDLDDLRAIAYPPDGLIAPVAVQASGGSSLLLDDLLAVPLDVVVDQATQNTPDIRFVTIGFVEVDPSLGFGSRVADQASSTPPVASFTATDLDVAVGEVVTFTDTSTGSYTAREWRVETPGGKVAKLTGATINRKWTRRGTYDVRFRAFGPYGSDWATRKTIMVGGG